MRDASKEPPIATPQPNTRKAKPLPRVFAALAAVVLLIAAGLFVQRGVLRAAEGSWDFTMVYAGARQLALGGNPYDFNATFDAYQAAGGTHKVRDQQVFNSLYPPMTYAVLAPLGLMEWPQAKTAWLLINLGATAAMAGWLIRHRPKRLDHTPGCPMQIDPWVGRSTAWAMALLIGSAALHTALAFGQLSILTVACMLPVLRPPRCTDQAQRWSWLNTSTIAAGLLLTLAGALKPQLMAIVAGLLLFTPRWRAVVWGMGGGLVVTAISVAWMQTAAPSWWTDWQDQLAFFAASGHANPTAQNPFTYHMIHLEPWLHRLWPDGVGPRGALKWFALGGVTLFGMITAALLVRHRPQTTSEDTTPAALVAHREFFLLVMGIAAVLTLLVGYHRTYDAVLLILPGLWVWHRLSAHPRQLSAWLALAAIGLFAFPGPVALTVAAREAWLPAPLTESLVWSAVIVPHHTLALLALLVVLMWNAMRPPAKNACGQSSPNQITFESR